MVAVLLFGCAPWLCRADPRRSSSRGYSSDQFCTALFAALGGAQTGSLSGFEAFKEIAVVNLAAGLISFPLITGGAYLGGVKGAVWGLAISSGVNCLLNYRTLRQKAKQESVPLGYAGCFSEWPCLEI